MNENREPNQRLPWIAGGSVILGIPHKRIARRLGVTRESICKHLVKMPALAFLPNAELSSGLTIPQVPAKYGWSEPVTFYCNCCQCHAEEKIPGVTSRYILMLKQKTNI